MLLSGQELGNKTAKQLEASRKQLWLSQRATVNQASKYRNSECFEGCFFHGGTRVQWRIPDALQAHAFGDTQNVGRYRGFVMSGVCFWRVSRKRQESMENCDKLKNLALTSRPQCKRADIDMDAGSCFPANPARILYISRIYHAFRCC